MRRVLSTFAWPLIIVMLHSPSLAVAQTGCEYAPPTQPAIYSHYSEPNQPIDSVRVVTQLHVKNTAQGGWEIEAVADRTDLSATQERWTITIIPLGGNDTLRKVLVDGADAYALERSGPFNDPVLTLTTPSDSATVRVADGTDDPEAIPFALLA